MRLEWFRVHRRKFFWITAIVVIPSMMLFGSMDRPGSGAGAASGPKAWYSTLDKSERVVTPQELIQIRTELAQYHGSSRYPGFFAMQGVSAFQIIKDMGLELGQAELEEEIRNKILDKTRQKEGSSQIYKALLDDLKLEKPQFERIVHQLAVIGKYQECVQEQTLITGADLFTQYCQDHQNVRLLFKAFRSKEYEGSAAKPTPNEIEGYYRTNKRLKAEETNALFSKAALAADVCYLPAQEIESKILPAEEELKKFFDIFRHPEWKKDPAKGLEPENMKPLAEVKEDVLKKFKKEKFIDKKTELLEKFTKEFKEEEGKAEKEKKPFDLAAFAQARGFKYWRTQALTRAEYKKGGEKPDAPDFKAAEFFFDNLALTEADAEQEKTKAFRRLELQPVLAVGVAPDNGFALMRIPAGGLTPPRLMSLEQATPEIERRLLAQSAAELARKAAEKAYEQWIKGEAIPKPEALLDETCDPKSKNLLAQQFFKEPRAVGEVLPVTHDPDPVLADDLENRHMRFLLGFAVEHKLPSYGTFEKDFSFAHPLERRKLIGQDMLRFGYNGFYPPECLLNFLIGQDRKDWGYFPSYPIKLGQPHDNGISDPPLFREERRGPPPPDDEY